MTTERIPVAKPDLSGNEKRYVNQALDEGWISSSGRFLDRFEQDFAAYCGVQHALTCCNGTVAIHLLLLAMGIGSGDEVIVPSFTYVASANGVTYTGATPVFIDSEATHWNLDPAMLEAAITPRTKAIMAVHLYGHPADMTEILGVGNKYGIPVIEDAAEAHGAEVNGRRAGGLGHAATFSFFGNKIITTGEGGMITTDDGALAARIRQLRNQGMDPRRRYWFPILGYNYRMTNVTAAIGCGQLERIDELIAGRLRIAVTYDRHLKALAVPHDLQLPSEAPWARHVHWLYSLRLPAHLRDPLMRHLDAAGIESRPFFSPMHCLPMYADARHGVGKAFPVAELLGATGLNLPTYHGLTGDQIETICVEVKSFLER